MEKRKKTHVDYVLERETRHAYGVLDDLKFIRKLYREDRQEQAYGFSLMTVKAAEELALNVRHLAVSLNVSGAEEDVQHMVDQTYKVEIGFTEDNYFCMRIPLLVPMEDRYSFRYLERNLTAALQAFWKYRAPMNSRKNIIIFRHVYDIASSPWESPIMAESEEACVIKLLFRYAFLGDYSIDVCRYHCCALGHGERTEIYVVPIEKFSQWIEQEPTIPESGWKLHDPIPEAEKESK